jgi:hypothetical protein
MEIYVMTGAEFMEVASSTMQRVAENIPFSGATWFVILTLAFFVWLFSKANKNPKSPVRWEHLVVDSQNDRTSPYKLGFLIGVIVSTWIVIRMSDAGKLTFDIFGMYLGYLVGGAGINSFAKAKQPDKTEEDPQ